MGGTLEQKIGGHNLYEPAALGKFIIGGPYYNNFPDIGKELAAKGVYKIVKDPNECLQILVGYKNIDWKNVSKKAVSTVSKRRGSIQCILKEIHRFIA